MALLVDELDLWLLIWNWKLEVDMELAMEVGVAD